METGRYYRTRAFISSRNRVEGTSTDFEAILAVPIAADGWRLRSATIPMQMKPWTAENSRFTVQWTSLEDASIKIGSPLVIIGVDYLDTPNEPYTFNVPPGTYTLPALAAVLRQLRPAGLVSALTFDDYTGALGAFKYLEFTTLARPDLLPSPMSIAVSPAWGAAFDLIYTRVGTFGGSTNYVSLTFQGSERRSTFERDVFYSIAEITTKLEADIGITPPPAPASGIGYHFTFDDATQNVLVTMNNTSTDEPMSIDLFFPGPVFAAPGGYVETVVVNPLQTVTRAVYKTQAVFLDPTTEFRFTPNLAAWNATLPYTDLQYVVDALNGVSALPPLASRANSEPTPWWARGLYGEERLFFKSTNWHVTSSRPLTELGLATTTIFNMLPNGKGVRGQFEWTGGLTEVGRAPIVAPATIVTIPAGNYNSSPYVLPLMIQTALQPWNIAFDPILDSDGSVAYTVSNDGTSGVYLRFNAPPRIPVGLGLPPGLKAEAFNLGLNAGRFESFRVMPNPDYHVSLPLTLPAAGPANMLSDAFVKEQFAHDTSISIADGTYDATQLATMYTAAIAASPIGARMSFVVNAGVAQLQFAQTQAPNNLGYVLIGTNDKLGFTKAQTLPAWAQPTALIPEIAFADHLGPDQTREYTATRAYRNLPTTSLFIASPTLTSRSVCTMGARFHSDIIAHVPIANAVQEGDLVEFINPVSEFEPWGSTRTISDIQIRLLDDQMRELGDDGSGQDCMIFLEFITAIG